MTQDNKIEQSPIIAAQIAKALQGHDGSVNITINMNATQIDGKIGNDIVAAGDSSIDVLAFIKTFPQPRFRNFINHIYFLAESAFGTKKAAAEFLGISTRTIYRIPLKEGGENGENSDR